MTPHSSPPSDGESGQQNDDTPGLPAFWGWKGLPIAFLLALLWLIFAPIKYVFDTVTRLFRGRRGKPA